MKAIRSFRYVLLLSFLTALFSLAFNAGLATAAPLSSHGSTGQALALRASLRALTPQSSRPATFKQMSGSQDLHRGPDGRFIYSRAALMRSGALLSPRVAGSSPQVNEAVQTYDVFSPPPGFLPTQGPSLTPINLTPVWTADESMLVFSSNRTATGTVAADGRFHIWAIPVNGGAPIQLTSSTVGPAGGGEFFPALSADTNRQIAFTSDANSPGVQNLYTIPVPTTTVSVTALSSPTIRTTDPLAIAQGGLGFSQVQRPTFAPGNPDEIVFSAFSTAGSNANHNHLYYLYVHTGGYDPQNVSLPAKITDGSADDIDPAFSQDGQLLAFASTAGSLTPTGLAPSSDPNSSLLTTGGAGTNHSIFLIGGGVRFGFATITNATAAAPGVGSPVTLAGTDNTGPAWSSLRRNSYTNPAPGFEYLAFARGTAPGQPHDIYYLQVLQNTDASGETGKSNEGASTPLPVRSPVYQVNAGDVVVGDKFGNYVSDTYINPNGPQGFTVAGGATETINPAPVTNTTNDTTAPKQIYLTDRNGPAVYTFRNLTPNANYRVRLHLADQKDTAAGQRVFSVTLNGANAPSTPLGQTSPNIDIVAQAQSAPGRIDGLVYDATGGPATPLAATVTAVSAAGATFTFPATATATADPNGGATPINFNGSLPQGNYTVTVTPAQGSGYSAVTQTVNISSGAYTRVDFPLPQGTGTLTGTVVDNNSVPSPGLPITIIDDLTGQTVGTTNSGQGASAGTFSIALPPTPAGDKYDVTVTPPAAGGQAVQTKQVVITAQNTPAAPATVAFTLASGAGVGALGGLVTNGTTGAALSGALVKVLGAGNSLVAILTTGGSANSPAAPNGDGKPVNYLGNLPTGSYTVAISAIGYAAAANKTVAVVNTTGPPANAFVRDDQALTTTAPAVGQNTAVIDEFDTNATSPNQFFFGQTTGGGTITITFNPVSGDPPIVNGVEIVSSPSAPVSSGFGDLTGTSFFGVGGASAPPQITSVFGGIGTDANGAPKPQETISFFNGGTSTPTSYNLYRSPAAGTSTNNPPVSNAGTEGTTPYLTNVPVTAGGNGFLQVVDTTALVGQQYYYQLTAVFTQTLTPETAAGGRNAAVKLNTDDNSTATVGGVYDDIYPTWSPFNSVFSIAYSSNRTVTYNDPASGATSETALSIARGGKLSSTGTVGAQYTAILVSQVVNLDPPTLLPYSGNEVVHVANSAGQTTRYGITPGQTVTFVARLSSREAGLDNTGAANGGTGAQVYLQIKNPNSKYQDTQGLEHKVFARDGSFRTQRNNPKLGLLDSGSSIQLMNGGGYLTDTSFFGGEPFGGNAPGFNRFTDSNGNIFYLFNRGAVAGTEDAPGAAVPGPATNASDTISIGRYAPGTVNGQTVADINGKPVTDPDTKQIVTNPPGSDPTLFTPWGPEFECQVVNPQFNSNPDSTRTAGDTGRSDFRDPYYLAGIDDQQPFSGAGKVRAVTNTTSGNTTIPAEWLQMTRLPDAQQDGQGGVLYGASWTTPISGSDFYMDVIAFDKAVAPATSATGASSNWRIYDNIWGFSTAASIGNNDILVVSDYALGQKFAATTFGGQRGLLNLVPKLFGAESYVTDIDVNLLPNAVMRHTVITGASVNNPNTEIQPMGSEFSPTGRLIGLEQEDLTSVFLGLTPQGVLNGLGVGSYYDRFIDDSGRIDSVPAVRSQQYSIWRVLSRGPVPASVYQSYLPGTQPQPAVADPSGTAKFAATTVPVANRCILWISPFTGDVLAGAGTLADSATQASLRAFVAAGGRLCVSGQNVASTVTQNGQTNNAVGGFLSDVLGATFSTYANGTHILTAGNSVTENRISNTPNYDGFVIGGYLEFNPGRTYATVAPGQRLLRISNNYDGNIFARSFTTFNTYAGNWRTDGSLDNLGPYIQPYPIAALNSNSVVSAINTITPNKGSHTDISLAPFTNPIPPLDNGDDSAATRAGGIGLIYTENPITASGGTGSKVVFATFGLEALSAELYKVTTVFKPNPVVYLPRNQRANIIHNIVDYLRTGSISGTVRSTSGNGVVGSGVTGVTVYLKSAFGAAIPGRGTFSATTDASGAFRMDGIEPGNYTIAAYRTGYLPTTSNPGVVFTVEGDTLQQASLTLVPAAAGSLSGKVTDTGGAAVAGASITFTSADGQIYTVTSDANGNYTLSSVSPGTYTGTATKTGFGTATQTAIVVASNAAVTVNFTLQPGPGSATGRVLDSNGAPIKGATVFFSSGSPATVVATLTTDATGTYTINPINAGTYNVTATATGFGTSAPLPVVITGGTLTTVPDIQLGAVANGTLGGLVTSAGGAAPLAGVTLTITNTGTGQVVTPKPVTVGTSAAAPDGGQINYGPITLAQGAYTVVATASNGVATGSQSVTIGANVFSRLDFTGVNGLPALHTFPAGLSFLSLPFDYSTSSFDTVFGALNTAPAGTTPNGNRSRVAVWDPTINQYALDPTPPADAIRLGVGYWVFLKNAVNLTVAGTPAPSGTVSVALSPSWNQIGVPSTAGVAVSSLSFVTGTTTLTFADAASSANHVVSPTLYRFDGANYQAVLATDTLQPYTAYWIKVYVNTTVRIPTGR